MKEVSTPSLPRLSHPSVYWVTWVFLAFLMPLAWLLLAYLLTFVSVIPAIFVSEDVLSNVYRPALLGIVGLQVAALFTVYATFQWLVLARFGISFRSWFISSIVGMTIGLLMSLLSTKIGSSFLNLDLMRTSPIGGIIIGLLFGSSLGVAQSFSLRTISDGFKYWVLANTIAYICGLVFFQVLWLAAVRTDEEGAGFLLYCFLPFTSVIIGAITGFFLIWPIGTFRRIQNTAS